MKAPELEGDRIGSVPARVYRTRTDDDVEIAVTRLSAEDANEPGEAVVLLHGTFCQRSFWISRRGDGLGPYLRARGYDVWVPELRGHGRSPKDDRYRGWSAEDHMRWDLPAIQRLVADVREDGAHWLGHSWGGVAIAGALARSWLSAAQTRSTILLGANISEGDRWMASLWGRLAARALVGVFGRVPARQLGLGPEPASEGYVLDFLRWKDRRRRWTSGDGANYWDAMPSVEVPLLAFAAANDRNDPPSGCRALYDALGGRDKSWILLGEEEGFSMDYDHVGMLISRAARQEVWPRIADWLDAHSQPPK